MAILTFSAVSGNFTAQVWKRNPETFVVDIPLDEPFNTAPYAPAQTWDMPTNEIRIYPVDGTILAVENDPVQGSLQWEQDGDFFKTVQLISSSWSDFTVLVTATGGAVETIAPYNRVYLVDSDIIGKFSNIVAKPPESSIDYSDFVIRLVSLPFKLDDGLSEGSAPIALGGLITDILAPVLNTDLITINLGTITVDGFKNNSLDFTVYEYKLFLPYSDLVIELEPKFILDGEISVVYILDAYSGDVTVNVYSEAQTEPIKTAKIILGRTIPFKMFNDSLQSNVGAFNGASNGVLTAYIQKIEKVVSDGEYSNTVKTEGVLGDYSGFLTVEEIKINTKANYSEVLEIKSLLARGVIINA